MSELNLNEDIRFRYPWRTYQYRILENMKSYLDDRKIHIIAPPGSGKTVLGLEILRRLRKKTLVLSPTIAIRDQWILRWDQDFLFNHKTVEPNRNLGNIPGKDQPFQKEENKNQTSFTKDLREDHFLISSTYQTLFSMDKRGEPIPKVDVLVVDEAHHLRREWWKSLETYVKITNPFIIALTATPPWDVEDSELRNYLELCGNIDEEISVPELVATGDLCPHQDYLILGIPSKESTHTIREFQDKSITLWEGFPKEKWVQNWVTTHPYIRETTANWDEIYKNPDLFVAIVILCKKAGLMLNPEIQTVLKSEKISLLPNWNSHYATIMIQHIFENEKKLIDFKLEIDSLRVLLRKHNILKGKKLDFSGQEIGHRYLVEGSTKIQSIQEIISHENKSLGDELRMVILTDYIRKEYLKTKKTLAEESYQFMGTVPIFQEVFPIWKDHYTIVHITGSLILVSGSFCDLVKNDSLNLGNFSELEGYNGIFQWNLKTQEALPIITNYLNLGKIQIVIGTMSLLGEGWDAPGINSLVLATSVGSYMLSNQSRGRAIRIDKNNPDKVSNIWHLNLVNLTGSETNFEFKEMQRRFRAFAGPSFSEPVKIETGLDRMDIQAPVSEMDIQLSNQRTFVHADDRQRLKDEWKRGIDKGKSFAERIQVKGWEDPSRKQSSKGKTWSIFGLMNILHLLLIYAVNMIEGSFQNFLWKALGSEDYATSISYIVYIPSILLIPRWFQAFRDVMIFSLWKGTRNRMSLAVLDALKELKMISLDSDLKLSMETKADGSMEFFASGGLLKEREILIRSLEDLFQIPTNPRYIIKTSIASFRFFGIRYFQVPEFFGKNKESSLIFLKNWIAMLGSGELIYTRTPSGRAEIFRARISSIFRDKIELIRGGVWI